MNSLNRSAPRGMTRRNFLKAALAAPALYTLGRAAESNGAPGNGPFDVAIVGAGSAGLGAAQILRQAGKKFIVLEARDRVGGRTFTDTTSFPGISWDLGAQWFHQVTPKIGGRPNQTNNPLYDIAVARHIPVFPDLNPRILRNPPTDLLDSPVLPVFGEAAIDILVAGFNASVGLRRDISAAAATAHLQNQAWYDIVWGLLQAAFGAGLDALSCLDFYNLSATALLPPVVPSIDNWLIPSGLGALVTSLASGIPIGTGTPVTGISWGGRTGVTLDTSAGTVRAKAAIVTAPLGTLTSGLPEFSPALPAHYLEAFAGLKMGNTAKIGLLFAPSYVFDVPQDNTFVSPYIDQREEPLVQTRAWGHKNFAIVIIGGKQVLDLEAQGELVDYALEQIVVMFGSGASAAFQKGVATSWNTDPFSLGGYSYALPGGVPGRRQLARPLAGQIFFAGEAVSIGSHSSAHGAWETRAESGPKGPGSPL